MDLDELETLRHSASGFASERSGSCPSARRFFSNSSGPPWSNVIAERCETRPWPSSVRRVVAVGSGARAASATDQRPLKRVHEPGHPDANADGDVFYPDINVVEEMTNLMTATRTYEAGVSTINTVKSMYQRALTLGA